MAMVSVVVATYRRDSVLERALESLATQTHRDFEIILVDDNDDSEWNHKVATIVNRFKENHRGINFKHIENHPNQGSAKTRNIGIECADGEFVCFLDDDDIYLPKRISNQVIPMQIKNADYGVTDLALYSESDKLLEERKRDYIEDVSQHSLLKYHLMYHITGTDTMMFRKDYLVKVGGFSPIDVGDEFYLMQKAIEAGGRFLHIPVCDVKAYVHTGDNGLSSGQSKIDGENALYKHKKEYFDRLSKRSVKYIKVRHYSVIAYAYFRMKCMCRCLKNVLIGFFISPMMLLKILFNR